MLSPCFLLSLLYPISFPSHSPLPSIQHLHLTPIFCFTPHTPLTPKVRSGRLGARAPLGGQLRREVGRKSLHFSSPRRSSPRLASLTRLLTFPLPLLLPTSQAAGRMPSKLEHRQRRRLPSCNTKVGHESSPSALSSSPPTTSHPLITLPLPPSPAHPQRQVRSQLVWAHLD